MAFAATATIFSRSARRSFGKRTTIRQFLDRAAADQEVPDDWCYINNFQQPHRPRALRLPPGMALKLSRDMERLVEELQSVIQAVFESEDYRNRRQAIEEEFKERQEAAFGELQGRARERGVGLLKTPMGLALAPVRDGEVVTPDEFQKLAQSERAQIEGDIEQLQGELQSIMLEVPQWDKERREKVRELDREVTIFAVGHLLDEVRATYTAYPQVVDYLDGVRSDVIDHVGDFRGKPEEGTAAMPGGPVRRRR